MASKLEIGIVGLPNVGKSTLFNVLTNSHSLVANYPFTTIKPNTGIVKLPDDRLLKLADLYNHAPIKPSTVTFVDIAGIVAGASHGEGLGNQFLANIRTCDALVHVVRAFRDGNITHVNLAPDQANDIDTINTELVLADLQTVERRLPKLAKEASANSKLKPLSDKLHEIRRVLDGGQPVHQVLQPADWLGLEDLQLLTMKPVIYVFNMNETGLTDQQEQQALSAIVSPAKSIFICAKLESELESLDESDRQELLASYGVTRSGLEQLILAAFATLGLQTYLTAGPDEVRAWTIPQNTSAPRAAGVIHNDFERGFIAAEVVNYDDLINAGSFSAAKAAGKVRTEGKTYIMQLGDIVEFRFNVSK